MFGFPVWCGGLIPIIALIVLLLYSFRILREYERAVVFLLGRLWKVKGPGLVIIIPFIQQMVRVDLRTRMLDVPPQDVISRDNVTVRVNAVVYYRVIDPEKAIIQVEHFEPPPASSRRPRCARCWASTTSTRCWPSAKSSTPTSGAFSTSRPTAGASKSPSSSSSRSTSTRPWCERSPGRPKPSGCGAPR